VAGFDPREQTPVFGIVVACNGHPPVALQRARNLAGDGEPLIGEARRREIQCRSEFIPRRDGVDGETETGESLAVGS
jgi:hypothetical protein